MEVNGQPQALATLMLKEEPPAPTEYSWVGPRVGMDVLQKRKISCPYQDSNPRLSSPWPSVQTYFIILAPIMRQ